MGYPPDVSKPSRPQAPLGAFPHRGAATGWWERLLPLVLLLLSVGSLLLLGGDRLVSFDDIARQYAALTAFVAMHPVLALLASALVYVTAIALSLPVAWLLTGAMGLIFGWAVGSLIAVVSATLGASLLFLIARSALSGFFSRRAGHLLNRFADGFRDDAASYLLFLRLVPVFPFALLNVVPAILGVRFSSFFWTTLVGIIPGTVAYAAAGEGLRSIVVRRAAACALDRPPCGERVSAGDLLTPQILVAFALLAIVSLLPVILKRIRRSRSAAAD